MTIPTTPALCPVGHCDANVVVAVACRCNGRVSAGSRPTPTASPTGSTADGIAANCSITGSRDLDGSAAGGVAT